MLFTEESRAHDALRELERAGLLAPAPPRTLNLTVFEQRADRTVRNIILRDHRIALGMLLVLAERPLFSEIEFLANVANIIYETIHIIFDHDLILYKWGEMSDPEVTFCVALALYVKALAVGSDPPLLQVTGQEVRLFPHHSGARSTLH